jgi:hypothetical protein
MNGILIANLLEEIRRVEGKDPHFIIGYLSGVLEEAANRSTDVRLWLESYLGKLRSKPDTE